MLAPALAALRFDLEVCGERRPSRLLVLAQDNAKTDALTRCLNTRNLRNVRECARRAEAPRTKQIQRVHMTFFSEVLFHMTA
jgi:hypothetical protein